MRLAVPVGPVHCVHYLTTWTIAHFGLLWLAYCCLVTYATLSRNTKVCHTKVLHPAAEYMALPASQYSVLDAQRIERLDEDTFRCYVGGLRLFSLVVEPVLTVSVVVGERGPTVKLLQTEVRSLGAQPLSIKAAAEPPRQSGSFVGAWLLSLSLRKLAAPESPATCRPAPC